MANLHRINEAVMKQFNSINHWIYIRRHKFIASYDNDTEAQTPIQTDNETPWPCPNNSLALYTTLQNQSKHISEISQSVNQSIYWINRPIKHHKAQIIHFNTKMTNTCSWQLKHKLSISASPLFSLSALRSGNKGVLLPVFPVCSIPVKTHINVFKFKK